MNTYEELQEEACNDGIEIIDNYAFKSERISGLYCDSTIALSKNLKRTTEKKCNRQHTRSVHRRKPQTGNARQDRSL